MRYRPAPTSRRILLISAATLALSMLSPVSALSPPRKLATRVKPRTVRMIYLVSSDRQPRAEYTRAIQRAITHLQRWYAAQLGGPTFRLHSPVVEVLKSDKPARWFTTHPNGQRRDDWGHNNALAEARRLVGARHMHPNHVWIIYSDGPGSSGRGGSGVAYLPEDDLLGLVGRHPTQKDRWRWVAGLGHELGHAFGLGHPTTAPDRDEAIMGAGIYGGRYPSKTYLTTADKAILRASPFFYHPDGRPVRPTSPRAYERLRYTGGAFERRSPQTAGASWVETKADSPYTFSFREVRRDRATITIHDASRGFTIRLPRRGGQSTLSTDGGKTWRPLYSLKVAR